MKSVIICLYVLLLIVGLVGNIWVARVVTVVLRCGRTDAVAKVSWWACMSNCTCRVYKCSSWHCVHHSY